MFTAFVHFSQFIFFSVLFGAIGAENDTFNNVMKINSTRDFITSIQDKNDSQTSSSISNEFIIEQFIIVKNVLKELNGSKCGEDISVLLKALSNKEKWAMRMLDASPKFPVGFFQGSLYQLGDFDECIYSKQPNGQERAIQGQYCLADLDLSTDSKYTRSLNNEENTYMYKGGRPRYLYNSTIHRAICVPSSCTTEEVKTVLKLVFISTMGYKLINVRLDQDKCHVDKALSFTNLELTFISLITIYICFVIFATIYHYFLIKEKSLDDSDKKMIVTIVLCFSIINSIRNILNTKKSSLNLECTNGIRFLTLTMILSSHALLFAAGNPKKNTDFIYETTPTILAGVFTNAVLYGDSFLVLSAFLMSYLLLRKLDKEKDKVSIVKQCVERYIRLTPTYLLVVFFYCSLLFRMGQGPLWDSRLSKERDRCLKSWWTHVVYLNNYINTEDICLPQSWQNAADYQLYVFGAFVIYATWKWAKIGKILLGSVFLITVLVPIIITYTDNLDPTLMVYSPEFYDITENFYFKTAYIKAHMRANSYFVGVIFGYALNKIQSKGIKVQKHVLWCGWITAAIFAILSMFSIAIYYDRYHEYNLLEVAVYSSLHKVAWCAALGWVMVVCVSNNASWINKFLSWNVFIPLSRLTYCAYLINGFVELYTLGTMRVPPYISYYNLMVTGSAHTFWTYAASAFITVLVEIPIQSFRNVIFKKV